MLSRLTLDRNSDVPLFRQLRAALEMRIIDGELADGTLLPSIRRLATDLDVATVTVVQAYKELQTQGYIQSVPKRGFFVAFGDATQPSAESTGRILTLIDEMFDAANETGIGETKAAQMVFQRLRERRNNRLKTVAIVGFRDASLAERVEHTSAEMADLGISAIGLSYEALEAMEFSQRNEVLQPIDVFLVSVGEMRHASALLEKHAVRIMPMTRVLRNEIINAIHRQPQSAQFGIIANSPEYADRMNAELRKIRPVSHIAGVAIVDDTPGVRAVVGRSNVILIGSLAASRLVEPIPHEVEQITFSFVPDTDTLNKLRTKLNDMQP